MQHIAALVKVEPVAALALRRGHPAIFTATTPKIETYGSGTLFVHGYFRDTKELGRFLNRLVGEHEIVDLDCRPVLPPAT